MNNSPANWSSNNNSLQKSYSLPGFKQAIEFVNKVAAIAEAENHHPEININYNKVTLTLTTHDADNKITQKDYSLAEKIDKLLQ